MASKIPTTKDKLASIVQGFDDFDSEMKVGTRQRREKEEYKIAEIKGEMKRLDQDLIAEIKRRTEMNKSTQAWFEEQLNSAQQEIIESLNERNDEVNRKLNELSNKLTALNEHFESEKKSILKQIDDRGQELSDLLNKFREDFESDRKQRMERENFIVKQLTDHEHEVNEKFERQTELRQSNFASVKALLEDNIRLRDRAEERFQAFFEKEVHQLQNEVQAERETREAEDDEIIGALNRYTEKLQSSLKIINSTDM